MEEKLDRILGQLTTITNRLNSHDSRLARVEGGKPVAGLGAAGEDEATDDHRTDADDTDQGLHRDHAWVDFRERALRDRDSFGPRGRNFDRDFYGRGARDSDDRGGRGFDDWDAHDFGAGGGRFSDGRGDRGYADCGGCGYFDDRGYDDRAGPRYNDSRAYDDRDCRGFGRFGGSGCEIGRAGRHSGRSGRDYDRDYDRFIDCHREPHRPPKIPFPTFDGESDRLTGLNKCDNFFRGHQVPEDEKVWMASLYVNGTAADWYYQMERDFGLVPWPRFVDFVNLHFGPPIRTNLMAEIKALVRTDTVEAYSRHFQALLACCTDLAPWTVIDLYTGGLGQPLAHDVEM